MIMRSISVRHNIEVAHRLSMTPGKCQNIHGHSMLVILKLTGEVDETGKIFGQDLAEIKELFREYLNRYYDHHLLLNGEDSLIKYLASTERRALYPGFMQCDADPTTENIAMWIWGWATEVWGIGGKPASSIAVDVQETDSNSASFFGAQEEANDANEVSSIRDIRSHVSGRGAVDGTESSVPEAERVQPPL